MLGTLVRPFAAVPRWRVSPAARNILVFAAAVLIIVLRRPEALLVPEFRSDDVAFYAAAAAHGLGNLIQPYMQAGYFTLAEQAAAILETLVRPVDAPLVGYVATILITGLVAVFLATDRMRPVIPGAWGRVGLGLLFVCLPGEGFFGSLANLQFVLAVYLVAMLVATPPASRLERLGDWICLLAAGLTGPFGPMLLPFFALRAWRDAKWRLPFTAIFGASIFQGAMILTFPRYAAAVTDWSLVPRVMAYRDLVIPLGGVHALGSLPLGIAAVIAAVALGLAAWRLPPPWLLGAACVAILIPLAGIRSTAHTTPELFDPQIGERYFFLTVIVVAGLVAAAVARHQWLALPAALILALGVAADFRIAPTPIAGWAQLAGCIGGPVACEVPVSGGPAFTFVWMPPR